MKYTGKNFTISAIIPCYGESNIVKNSVLALAQQWIPNNPYFPGQDIVSFSLEILLVNDDVEHPNKYNELIDTANKIKTGDMITIKVITNEKNTGQGLARQYGIDHCVGKFFVTCDEDDVYAPNAIYRLWEALFKNHYIITEDDCLLDRDAKKIAIVAAPLYGFDTKDYIQNIPSNSIWVNSSLYNKEFLIQNNIRYIESTSRHGEDYTFIKMFDFAYSHCWEEIWGRIDYDNDAPTFYYWYPNLNSQSRRDPYYCQRISGYTMIGSCEIIKYMRDFEMPDDWKNNYTEEEKHELLNMNVYCFFNILDFIKTLATTDFIPSKDEWENLRNASKWLTTELSKIYDEIIPSDIYSEFYLVHHHSDAHFVEPWVDFREYVFTGCGWFDMSCEEIIEVAHKMQFDAANHYENASYVQAWRKNRGIED